MKNKVISEIIQGKKSDYQFQFCVLNDGYLEFGVEENFNEYMVLTHDDNNYKEKLKEKLLNIQQHDNEFYNKIIDMLDK